MVLTKYSQAVNTCRQALYFFTRVSAPNFAHTHTHTHTHTRISEHRNIFAAHWWILTMNNATCTAFRCTNKLYCVSDDREEGGTVVVGWLVIIFCLAIFRGFLFSEHFETETYILQIILHYWYAVNMPQFCWYDCKHLTIPAILRPKHPPCCIIHRSNFAHLWRRNFLLCEIRPFKVLHNSLL